VCHDSQAVLCTCNQRFDI